MNKIQGLVGQATIIATRSAGEVTPPAVGMISIDGVIGQVDSIEVSTGTTTQSVISRAILFEQSIEFTAKKLVEEINRENFNGSIAALYSVDPNDNKAFIQISMPGDLYDSATLIVNCSGGLNGDQEEQLSSPSTYTASRRTVTYRGMITGDQSVSIATVEYDDLFEDEEKQTPNISIGFQYDLFNLLRELKLFDYNVVLIQDNQYRRVLNSKILDLTPIQWSLVYDNELGYIEGQITALPTLALGETLLLSTMIIRTKNQDVFVASSGKSTVTIPFVLSVEQTQILMQQTENVELIFVMETTSGNFGEIAFDNISIQTITANGNITGNASSWS